MPNLNSPALIVSEISAFIRTDGQTYRQTDIARSTRLVILIKNIYTLWGRKRFLLTFTLSDESSIPIYSTSNGYNHTGRACLITKGYVCVFVCFATKAIHLEPTSDLTTENVLAAFARFVARRGCL